LETLRNVVDHAFTVRTRRHVVAPMP